ncbi:MAG: hypothetical protein QME41_09025, partial [Actinomycetota bacterium]|nr:hypothetical protein [Actinomycetota bacterium]
LSTSGSVFFNWVFWGKSWSYQLQYAMKDGIILFGYFYEDVSANCLLGRKYEAFRKAVNEIRGGVV